MIPIKVATKANKSVHEDMKQPNVHAMRTSVLLMHGKHEAECQALIDTGATKSVIRKDLVPWIKPTKHTTFKTADGSKSETIGSTM